MENLKTFVPSIKNKFVVTTDLKYFENGRVVFVSPKRREIEGRDKSDVDICYSSNKSSCNECVIRPSCQNPVGN